MKKLKIKKLNKKSHSDQFYKKIFLFTILFSGGIMLFNFYEYDFFADISQFGKGLLKSEDILDNKEDIKDNKANRPVRRITHRGKVENYSDVRDNTNRNELSNSKKTIFPETISDITQQYKFVNPFKIFETISNPLERQKVSFYKRLLTTLRTSSYECNIQNCKRWIPDTGTHAGIDIVSVKGTPVYNSMNGIVIDIQKGCENNCSGFGNYVIVGTNFKGELITSFYAHLSKIKNGLEEGDIIKAGDNIGEIGNTGNSTVTHLHFQINNLGNIKEIKNKKLAKQLRQGWFDNISGVEKNTINPISFVEDNQRSVSDALGKEKQLTVNNDNTEETNNNNENTEDIINSIEDRLGEGEENKTHSVSEEKDFRIKNIKKDTITNKLITGNNIEFTLNTTGNKGQISITTNNNVLSPSTNIITPKEGKNKYNVILSAKNLGNGQVIFNDGKNKKDFYFTVYEENVNAIGLNIEGPNKIYPTIKRTFKAYPIDDMGNTISQDIKGNVKIKLENKNSNEETILKEFQKNDNKNYIKFDVKAPSNKDYKIKVIYNGKDSSLIGTKNTTTQLFSDYSEDDKFGNAIKNLVQKGIIKGYNGKLMPNENISRAQIISILIRHKYGDNKENFKSKMNEFMNKNGRFFKDINGNKRYAPYLFMAFKDKILKGADGKALPERSINKAEVITIYGRFFNVKKEDIFTNFLDVDEDDRYQKFANAAKSYNLYPFKNSDYFKAQEKVTREKAFVSLYRYIQHSKNDTKNNDDELEDTVRDLLKE